MESPQGRGILSRLNVSLPPALHYPTYRVYWLGTLASVSGFQVVRFGQFWLMYQLTESPVALGYVGLAQALPGIVLNLFGGVFADKVDLRRLVLTTQIITASLIFLLATLTLLDMVRVWHVLVIAFVAGAVNAFDEPARQALYPHLIDRKVMMSAVALNSAIWQGNRIVAPAVAGLIIAWAGTAVSFYLSGLGFLIMAGVMVVLRVPRVSRGARGSPAQDLVEGLSFIRKNSIFAFLIGMTFFISFFGLAYINLMPVFAVDILKVGADGQGLLMSIGGVGALLATIWLSSRDSTRYKGLLILGGAVMFGISLAAFALTSEFIAFYPLALVLMFAVGLFNSAYNISVMSSLQMMVPDNMRGRVMGFYTMTYSISPLGAMQAGALATLITVPFAIAAGGLAVVAFALGPALINRQVRHLGTTLQQAETATAASRSRQPSAANDG
ncbi:MAG: MFS transporter [Dehalococcoidia bacterium]